MTRIVPLSSQSAPAIDGLLDAAFGPDRHGRTAYRIRQGMDWLPDLSFAVIDDRNALLGTLQSWPVALHGAAGPAMPLVMVGPVAVHPSAQGAGHGRALMDAVTQAARTLRADTLMMIGDPDYYGRFWGFSDAGTAGWDAPGPFERHRLLALSPTGDPVGGAGMLGPRIAIAA